VARALICPSGNLVMANPSEARSGININSGQDVKLNG
jgi:hypothetical protein